MEEPKQKGSKEEGRAPDIATPYKQDGDSICRYLDISISGAGGSGRSSMYGASPPPHPLPSLQRRLSMGGRCIYAIPQFAEDVLKIDPATQRVTTIGGPFPGASPTGKHKWYGGLLGGDGCIYGIPQCANSVLKIDPRKQEVTTIGELPPGGWKWHGGVTGPDGCIYGAESLAGRLPSGLRTANASERVRRHSRQRRHGAEDRPACAKGADAALPVHVPPQIRRQVQVPGGRTRPRRPHLYVACPRASVPGACRRSARAPLCPSLRASLSGAADCIPSDADRVLRIDPLTNECVEMGETLEGRVDLKCNKWQNGFLARDGRICKPRLPPAAGALACEVAS